MRISKKKTLNQATYNQGCRVGVGVARSRGSEPGVGIVVNQAFSTPSPEHFVWICAMICHMQRRICMHFLEICTEIVFKFCSYTHIRINRGRGARTLKGISKGSNTAMPLKRPKIVQSRHIPWYNKKTKRLYFLRVWSLLLAMPQGSEIRILFRNWGTYLKLGHSQSPLSGSVIDDMPTFHRLFLAKIVVHSEPK